MQTTFRAKDYICICGRKAKFLNLCFPAKYGNAICEKCREKELVKEV